MRLSFRGEDSTGIFSQCVKIADSERSPLMIIQTMMIVILIPPPKAKMAMEHHNV